jgi:SAM-dependent methyltransferase
MSHGPRDPIAQAPAGGRPEAAGSTPPRGEKAYDEAYFAHWYRGPAAPKGEGELERSVALALAAAESLLAREVRTVLDVGAGEGRWQPVLQRLRPETSYLGIEPSAYARERYGDARNLREGRFGDLDLHPFDEPFDLVVCADVMHYLTEEELLSGIDTLADLVGGAAFLEVFTSDDTVEGDMDGFLARPARWYAGLFKSVGLVPLGLQLWTHQEIADDLDAMERVNFRG